MVNEKDMYKFRSIETLIESKIEKLQPPEAIGPGPVWKEKSSKNRNNNRNKNRKNNNFKKKKHYSKPKNQGGQPKS